MYSDLLRNLSADEQMDIKDVLGYFCFLSARHFFSQEWRAVQDIRKAETLCRESPQSNQQSM